MQYRYGVGGLFALAFEFCGFLLTPVTTDADNASNEDEVEDAAAAVDVVPTLPAV